MCWASKFWENDVIYGCSEKNGASEDFAFMRGRAQKGQVIINIGAKGLTFFSIAKAWDRQGPFRKKWIGFEKKKRGFRTFLERQKIFEKIQCHRKLRASHFFRFGFHKKVLLCWTPKRCSYKSSSGSTKKKIGFEKMQSG